MEEKMIIPLIDEEGNEVNFELMDSIEIEEMGDYVFLVEEGKDPEKDGVVILKVIPGEEEDTLISLDEEEIEEVLEAYESYEECEEDEGEE